MNRKSNLIIQLMANTIPLIGYWFFNWSMFAIIYLYWTEGLIVAFYSCCKIAIAYGPEPLKNTPEPFHKRLYTSLKFFLIRIGILLFYWIFIVAFIAHPSGLSQEISLQNSKILFFYNQPFNAALLIYFLNQLLLFLSTFIATDDYKEKPSSNYRILFDSRAIVLHIVIVLGTFTYQFFQRFESISDKLPALSYILLLLIIKSISDIIHYRYPETSRFKNQ